MKFVSTRGPSSERQGPSVSFGAALTQGLAPDGGLYIPEAWPQIPVTAFDGAKSLPDVAAVMLRPFVAGDPIAAEVADIARDAFDFPAPLAPVTDGAKLSVLELFHGPTAAFKDFGARFLAASMQRLRKDATRPLNILVATSGDTGGAVAAAFHRRPGVVVSVLFPKGLVSPTQERQLTCWGDNVHSYRVDGSFDDCQRLVKEAFVDPDLKSRFELSSANSINLGRLLPQAVYYAATSLAVFRAHGVKPNFVIPSGNLGNSVACVWARKIGLPIGRIVLAHNANRAVPDFLQSGEWKPRASVPTLASAMDVGAPSNMERLRALFPDLESVRGALRAESVSDDQIKARIANDYRQYGKTWCPHTATAAEVWARMSQTERADGRWVLVSTAHPAKFHEIVEPLIGERIAMPESLAKLFERPVSCANLEPELRALSGALQKT
jgi:threonine synthase